MKTNDEPVRPEVVDFLYALDWVQVILAGPDAIAHAIQLTHDATPREWELASQMRDLDLELWLNEARRLRAGEPRG